MSWILLYIQNIQNTEATMKNSSWWIALDGLTSDNLISFNLQTKRAKKKQF